MNHHWIRIGSLCEKNVDFSVYNKDIGVYRAILDEEIVYIGKATELYNGGFRKRLRDYTRKSASARNYPAGKLMYSYKEKILIEILIVKRDETGIAEASKIESLLISELHPKWNNLVTTSKGIE